MARGVGASARIADVFPRSEVRGRSKAYLQGLLSGCERKNSRQGVLRVTTQFGSVDPSHPLPHTGRDYAAKIGTPVFAPYSGAVSFAGSAGSFGNVVAISTPLISEDATNVYEGHLSSISVSPGQAVQVGDQIGLLGNTVHLTGPHLHLEQHTP